jgi:hypothetical protein
MFDPSVGRTAHVLQSAGVFASLADAVLCVVRLCLRKGGCWPPDLGLNSCDRGVTVQWRHTCGGGADVAALGGTGQIYAAAVVPAGDGVEFAMLDVAVQALPIEGLEGYAVEGLALLQCVSDCRASAKLMQHPPLSQLRGSWRRRRPRLTCCGCCCVCKSRSQGMGPGQRTWGAATAS